MKFSIVARTTTIGVLPFDQLLTGSTELGDVLNSWCTFVVKSLSVYPTHPLAILHKSIPNVIASASSLADSFKLEAAPEVAENDGVVTFKGVEYYVTDYETVDPSRTEVTLSCIQKSVVDASRKTDDEAAVQLDTLDLLFAFVTRELSNALNTALFNKQTAAAPVGVAGPALPKVPGGQYKALPYPAIDYSKPAVTNDVAAAQAALSALLQKGSL